jgi:phosphatidylserine/phosphatidylglycerophosphate/cardiolipin synthase-like enzyme
MILEQLVTAGTTTARCMQKLAKRYKTLVSLSPLPASRSSATPLRPDAYDEEAALGTSTPTPTPTPAPGALTIEFFEPRGGACGPGGERGEPLQSHLKLTVVDELVAVLGSGNMDRASWFTSQELGVAFFDREMAVKVREAVGREMEGRVRVFYKA